MKKKLETLVEEIFRPITPFMELKIRHYIEIHPKSSKRENKYFIQMTYNSKRENPHLDAGSSHFDMYYNPEECVFEYGNIELLNELKGIGLGRKLIEAREELARRLGCFCIRINSCTNKSFWKHMGYEAENGEWYKIIKEKKS